MFINFYFITNYEKFKWDKLFLMKLEKEFGILEYTTLSWEEVLLSEIGENVFNFFFSKSKTLNTNHEFHKHGNN